ncbi:MAG: glycoside hydrolase domain-containing protein [Candidatus Brocadiia bacterium]
MRASVALVATVCVLASAARAATYAELAAKAEAGLEHAAKAGKKAAAVEPPEKPYRPSDEDRERGLVVYVPPLAAPFTDRPPAEEEVRQTLEVQAAQGETESFLLAVHALEPQRGATWGFATPRRAGSARPRVRVELLPVVLAPMGQRRSESYRVVGLWLADEGAVDVPAGHSRAWLVRLHVDEEATPRDYALLPMLSVHGGQPRRAGPAIRLRVLPFRLADPWKRDYVFGAFCAGADFSLAQYREMKAHGIEAILWFWGHYGLDVRNDGGKLVMDFAALDRTVARFQEAGLRGPIVLALGNDCCGHFERAICQAFDLPMQPQVRRRRKEVKLAVLDDPRIEKLMVEALRQLFDHAKAHKWPEIVILPYDEPTERLMDEHRRMVRLFRTHFPHVRLYGVTMNRLRWAEMVSDTDILVANGDWARIRELATEKDKAAWFYGSVTTRHGYSGCRWRYGLRPYAYRPDGMWFWCYNFHPGDPWNDFDSFTPDSSWVIVWPPLEEGQGSVETLAYEGLREAVDDVRYAMTLEARLERADGAPAAKVRADYQRWLQGLQGAEPSPADVLGHRQQLIAWLEALGAE